MADASPEHLDVLIVGAGLSGIGSAYHLQERCPGKSYAILEAREDLGGTWDLFRYPGIRSDSDMHTLGYRFKPWTQSKTITDGASILDYVRQTARDHGIDEKIRFHHRVVSAEWSSEDLRWTVEAERSDNGETVRLTCGFLWTCSGYYRYDEGFTPDFEGLDRFPGTVVHPQHWPADLDHTGKRVVVIGSGATAVTLVPEMAKDAAHVTMLQRSPTYVVSRPAEDAIANWLRARLPSRLAYGLTRWKNVLFGMWFFNLARKEPEKVKQRIIDLVRAELGPDYDVATHFTPRYNPWDQRLCLVPDSDLFESLRQGTSSIVTDTIETFTENGLRLTSGKEIEADLIVTATGLNLQLMSDVAFSVDGATVDPSHAMQYRGMMYSEIPNLASSFGYTNASWTLKADLTSYYVCRLLNHMGRIGMRQATPRLREPVEEAPFLDFTSGYVQRSIDKFPRQGSKKPWRVYQNYALDIMALRHGRIADGVMEFSNPVPAERAKKSAAPLDAEKVPV